MIDVGVSSQGWVRVGFPSDAAFGGHPPPHTRCLVRRGDRVFTAQPCYGMHEPWWVVATMAVTNHGEVAPEPMQPEDQWQPFERVR